MDNDMTSSKGIAPLPEVIGDEYDEAFWSPGHHDPRRFIRAVIRYVRSDLDGDDRARDLLRDEGGHLAMVAKVRHVAFRYDDPNNDESMARCEQTHPEAELFTEVVVGG